MTTAQGLAGPRVAAIREDSLGNYWFGTEGNGISHYDRSVWSTLVGDTCLCDAFIHAIWDDRLGNLWFATRLSGVVRFNGERWDAFTKPGALPSNSVRAIHEDRSGKMWFGTAPFDGVAGVARYDPAADSWEPIQIPSQRYAVQAILEDRSGFLWFATGGGGVIRYDPVTGQPAPPYTTSSVPDEGLRSDDVRGIAEDEAGNLWFATHGGGLSRYDGTNWVALTDAEGLPSNDCLAVHVDRNGHIWVGLNGGGVARFDGVRWIRYLTRDGLAHNTVGTIYGDRSGYIWFGTEGGASRFDGEAWTSFTVISTANGLGADNVSGVLADRSGGLWFATLGGGVSRYQEAEWQPYTTATTAGGLASDRVRALEEDRSGKVWFGTVAGLSRFDPTGGNWKTFTADSGLGADDVSAITEDHSGDLWVGTYGGGVVRYRPSLNAWTPRFTTTNSGLASNNVAAILEDRSSHLWIGTSGAGVSRYDGTGWTTYTAGSTGGGPPNDDISSLLEDSAGRIWAGTLGGGLGRYDPGTNQWVRFNQSNTRDSLRSDYVTGIHEDRNGNIWIATVLGVSRFDEEVWKPSSMVDFLRGKRVNALLEDESRGFWFATTGLGVLQYRPDQVAPITVFRRVPASLSAARSQTAAASVLFEGARGNEFSFQLDGGGWSAWSVDSNWVNPDVGDGPHVLEARSRDGAQNADANAARTEFQVDATPPSPVIASPAVGQAVRDWVAVMGTVADARLREYRIEVRPRGTASWAPPLAIYLGGSPAPVLNDTLAGWNTREFQDGPYELRAWAIDSLGLVGDALVDAIVDNEAPWVDQTAPTIVSATVGGDIYTQDGAVHLYFPPHAFERDALIAIETLSDSNAPLMIGGATRVLHGYGLSWSPLVLRKTATLTLSLEAASAPGPGTHAVYVSSNRTTWSRAGGTVDARAGRISLPLTHGGWYAVYLDQGATSTARLSSLSLTPRVFSARGSFGSPQVGIGFVLGRSGPATVKVFSRAGRLVRDVASGVGMGAGANLIWWDGRDREGVIVKDGLYFVVVEALGEVQTKTLAVVK